MGVETCLWLELGNKEISNDLVKFVTKNINTNFIACQLLVKRVATFGAVLYRNN